MWRLKLKETLERITVLDCKNWTCGTPNIQQQNASSTTSEKFDCDSVEINDLPKCKTIDHFPFGPDIFLPCRKSCSKKNSSSGSSKSNNKEKWSNHNKISDNEGQLTDDILGAITWSGAIIFGWYASQILCTRRRHNLGCNYDDDQNKYLKYLYVPKRAAFYSNINSHLVCTSPIQQQNSNPTTLLSNRIKYVEIPLLDNKIEIRSNCNDNYLLNQSETELSLEEASKIKQTISSSSLAEYSTNNDISSGYSNGSKRNNRISSNKKTKFLNNKSSTLPKENLTLSLHQINNSSDSSESSITSSTFSNESKVYCTDDSSSSFIEFREDTNDLSSSPKHKIYEKTDIEFTTDNKTPKTTSTTSATSEIPDIKKPLSELVQHLAEFEYKAAAQHIKNKDYVHAIPHLKRATTHLHPSGIFNLGLCYEKGLGVRQNLNVAMECYQKASHLGHPKATFNLGVFYAKGLGGLPKNIDIARKCIITAAKLGQPEAISYLNSMAVTDEEIGKYLKEKNGRSPSIDSGL